VPPPADRRTRLFYIGVLAVLLLAGVWRLVLAGAMPAVSRDGVTFCWYARDLGTQGSAYLRGPDARQHPLFPVLILAAQRTARALGAADTPLTWQRSGQLVSGLAGLAAVGLVGALTARLVRRLALPLDGRLAAVLAMLLAALLDLNVWLSCDVLSDGPHLVFYLAAGLLLVQLESWRAAAACGLLSGLAFLTRPEGAVPLLAGLVALGAARRQMPPRRLLARAGLLLLGFLVCAVPYWTVVGRFSAKKDVLEMLPTERAVATVADEAQGPSYALGKLELRDVRWYALLPVVLYELMHAGRVVVPLLALPPLLDLRRRLLAYPLAGLSACASGHLALTLVLLGRFDYLSTRHLLVPVMLLTPLAAMLLARVTTLLWQVGWRRVAVLVVAVSVVPSALYALRIPNGQDGYLTDAAAWLTGHDPDIRACRLLSGSSPRRIAFYADMRWEFWAEQPEYYAALTRLITRGGRGYFALEVGPGFERAGNRELLDKLLHDPAVAAYVGLDFVRPGPDARTELHLVELRATE